MKLKNVCRVLAITLSITVACPSAALGAERKENIQTAAESRERKEKEPESEAAPPSQSSEGAVPGEGDGNPIESETIGTGDHPIESETPGTGDDPVESETPGTGDHPVESETPGTGDHPIESETPGTGDHPAESETPGTGDHPGESETPGTGSNPGESETSGTGGNPGESEPAGTESASGESETPGTSGTETELPPVVVPGETETGSGETELPSVVDPADESQSSEPGTEEPAEKPSESETKDSDDHKKDKDKKDKDQKNKDKKDEDVQDVTLTNAQLIAAQKLVIPPAIEESFRFITVDKVYAVARTGLKVYEEKSTDAAAVGEMEEGALCYVLNSEDSSWYYIESGVVRGFVKADELMTGEDAVSYVEEKKEANLALASVLMDPMENQAFTYTKTTVRGTVVGKSYALAKGDTVNIRESKGEDGRIVGTMENGVLCYVLADGDEDWVYVESGDVRGFVKAEYLRRGEDVDAEISSNGENSYGKAEQLISTKENRACYYTITSVKKGSVSEAIRSSMVEYAEQFIGNPYVWGGTSLTNGADCSGFVQSIYAAYGYSIPRVAEAQSQYGMQIPVSEVAPGDLVFYAKNGSIYHVAMYVGDGKVIEAANSSLGIICSNLNSANAVWATRIISDTDSDKIEQVNENAAKGVAYTKAKAGDSGEYLGRFKLTAYCSCPICCGQWSGGPTASGTIPVEGRTVAIAGIPFGTRLVIGGLVYTVEDRGTPYGHVDLYMNSHTDAQNFGVQYADVYLAN